MEFTEEAEDEEDEELDDDDDDKEDASDMVILAMHEVCCVWKTSIVSTKDPTLYQERSSNDVDDLSFNSLFYKKMTRYTIV